MQVKVETSAIMEALRIVKRLAPPANGAVTIVADGKKLTMTSRGDTNQCQLVIPADVEGSAEFGMAIESLEPAIKGRGELTVKYKQSMLHIRAGNYSASLPTTDSTDIDGSSVEGGEVIKISSEQAGWLRQAVSATALKATTLVSSFMPLGVKLTKKGAFVTCFDISHMSWLSSKEISGDADFVVPADLLAGVLDAFGAQSFVLTVSKSAIEVKNKISRVRLNLPELEDQGPTLQDVYNKAKELKEIKGKDLVMPKADITAFLDNSKAVALKERGEVHVKADGQKILLTVTTVNGTAKAGIPTKLKGLDFKIDYEYFDEMVRKSADPVVMRVSGQAFLICTSGTAAVAATFNRE